MLIFCLSYFITTVCISGTIRKLVLVRFALMKFVLFKKLVYKYFKRSSQFQFYFYFALTNNSICIARTNGREVARLVVVMLRYDGKPKYIYTA